MRVGAFVAAFVVPFAVAALPLLTLIVNPFSTSGADDGRLALSDVPITSPVAEPNESAPLAYGNAHTSTSPECGGTSIVAIEG